jgi:hypothetical protein
MGYELKIHNEKLNHVFIVRKILAISEGEEYK